jgi:hypothetical protein
MPKSDGYKNLKPPVKGEIRNHKGRGSSLNTKTILNKFLNQTMKQKNPFSKETEEMSVLELMNLKQIANALEGDLQAYREIIDRYEGKVKHETDITSGGEKIATAPPTIVFMDNENED